MLMLFEENDNGEAGNLMYDSVLALALLWIRGPPPPPLPPLRPELASVTSELAPILGPEVAMLFMTVLVMSPTMFERMLFGIEFVELLKEVKWGLFRD